MSILRNVFVLIFFGLLSFSLAGSAAEGKARVVKPGFETRYEIKGIRDRSVQTPIRETYVKRKIEEKYRVRDIRSGYGTSEDKKGYATSWAFEVPKENDEEDD